MKRVPSVFLAIALLVGYALSPGPRAAIGQAIAQYVGVTPTGSSFPVSIYISGTVSGPASTTAAPGANVAVCNSGSAITGTGWYEVALWVAYVSGTEQIPNNMQLNVSGTTKRLFVVNRPASANAVPGQQTQYKIERVYIPGGTWVSITAVANATAGAVYDCQIDLTPVPL